MKVKRTDDIVVDLERQRQFRASIGQQFIGFVDRAGRGIQCNHGLPGLCHLPDNAVAPHSQFMTTRQEFFANVAGRGSQNGKLTVGVAQENLGMIHVFKALQNQIDDLAQQCVHVADTGDNLGNVTCRFQVARAFLDTGFEDANVLLGLSCQGAQMVVQDSQFILLKHWQGAVNRLIAGCRGHHVNEAAQWLLDSRIKQIPYRSQGDDSQDCDGDICQKNWAFSCRMPD